MVMKRYLLAILIFSPIIFGASPNTHQERWVQDAWYIEHDEQCEFLWPYHISLPIDLFWTIYPLMKDNAFFPGDTA